MNGLKVEGYRLAGVEYLATVPFDSDLSEVPEDIRGDVSALLVATYGEVPDGDFLVEESLVVMGFEAGGGPLVPGLAWARVMAAAEFGVMYEKVESEDMPDEDLPDDEPAGEESNENVGPVDPGDHPAACPFGSDHCPHAVCPHGL